MTICTQMSPDQNMEKTVLSNNISESIKTVAPYTPIQYVMGRTEFCGLDFMVDERVLIPRPETELLVETVIDIAGLKSCYDGVPRILDLCTGSGNIAISLAARILTKGLTNCKITASDISDDALEVARQNAALNGVQNKIDFLKSDLFSSIDSKFDIIASNPPYIARHEFPALQEEVLREPILALDGGEDGLDFYRRIIALAPEYLRPGGSIIMEIGYGQMPAIADIIAKSGSLKLAGAQKDHNMIDRIVTAEWIN